MPLVEIIKTMQYDIAQYRVFIAAKIIHIKKLPERAAFFAHYLTICHTNSIHLNT
jgi:hypothetical protein